MRYRRINDKANSPNLQLLQQEITKQVIYPRTYLDALLIEAVLKFKCCKKISVYDILYYLN